MGFGRRRYISVPKKEYPEIFHTPSPVLLNTGDIVISKSLKIICRIKEVHSDLSIIEYYIINSNKERVLKISEVDTFDLKPINIKIRDPSKFYIIYLYIN